MFLQSSAPKRAICYFRHSAEDKQENSVAIQRQHVEKFAAKHEIEIIHEEADEGVSGITEHRPAFQRLFDNWIENPDAPPFDYVLVYDVSRWGRFQDLEEATLYSIRCKRKGKKIIYVDQGFPKEGDDFTDHLLIQFKRWKAADFSRELSGKVFWGGVEVTKQGYSAGGIAPYGLSRLLLDESKKPIGILKKGERKIISNQRVTFIPSNDHETETVREIFNLLTESWRTPAEIAAVLNTAGNVSANGQPWNTHKIIRVLSNEAYAGSMVYNKTWGRLKQKKRANPKAEWVICLNAFEAIIPPEQFVKAQEHLYWLMPTKWKRGVYAIRKVKRLIIERLSTLLVEHGEYTDDDIWKILHQLPLAAAVSFYREGKARWCFSLPDSCRKNPHIFGVSVNLFDKEPADKFFLIPSQDFGMANYLMISESDEQYGKYVLNPQSVETSITQLCKSLI